MAKSKHYYIRKTHRYLGLILGIQFLFWTIGGLYFSWSNIDEVHGDFQKKKTPMFSSNMALVSPSIVLDNIKKLHPVDAVAAIQLIEILGSPFYQVRLTVANTNNDSHDHAAPTLIHLADAVTGKLRGPLTKEEAITIASRRFNGDPQIQSVEYLTSTNGHHEYRESPLPAYAVTFRHPTATTVYVSADLGTVQKFRNNKWRTFDFLWMLHTMDYQSRDNINNILLCIFSIFGVVTIISGFVLYGISSRTLKKRFRRREKG